MLTKIDHIAIVVKDAEAALKNYAEMFGFKAKERMEGPGGEFKVVLASAGDITLEFLQPLKPGTAFSRFLEERGGGLHHVSYVTNDIVKELKDLKKLGKRLLNEEPISLPGSKVAFVHPSAGENVLIELVQRG
jgi:methylmalonyl-CoA/ethylmalonyl-CoA epimerase